MEKTKLKTYLLLISFTVGLVLCVVHFETILYGIGFVLRLLTPLFIGVMIAFVLNRPYKLFRKWYVGKLKIREKPAQALAIVTVYLMAFGVVALIIGMIVPEFIRNIKTFAGNADQYLIDAQNALNTLTGFWGMQAVDLTNLIEIVHEYFATISNVVDEMLPQIMEITSSLVSAVATAFVSIALSVYLLSGKERLLSQAKRALRVYLPKRMHRSLSELFQTVSQVFGDYVAGQCKEALILGVLCFIGMMILRLDYAALISTIIAVTALIPIMGAYLGGAVAVLLLLFISPGKALLFLIFLIILQQIEGNVIYPRVVGRKIGLPGIWVLLGISVGGGLFGIWGMLLAVPITTIVYQIIKKDVRIKEEQI